MKSIVILGGSYAGLNTAHKILKTLKEVKVTIVSPNTHFYWNLASVRAIVPGQIPDSKIFQEIAPGFKQYSADKFEFLLGAAEKLDVENKKVTVATAVGPKTDLAYDVLILATGSKAKGDTPWKIRESYEATRDALHSFQERVKSAKSIILVGSGPTGVESAGELGFEYGTKKEITLIASGARVLESAPESVSKAALSQLQKLHVNVKLSTKVQGTSQKDGSTEVILSSGEKLVADLYLPSMGLVPNSSYVPQQLLNANGFVKSDEFLRVKGTDDIWAVGDISDIERPQLVNTSNQFVVLVKNIGLVLAGKQPVAYTPSTKPILAVPVGRKSGTGHAGTWKLPGFMVNYVKGKTLFLEKMAPLINGTG